MIRHYLATEPEQDMERLMDQYAEAIWMEARTIDAMAAAIAKAMGSE